MIVVFDGLCNFCNGWVRFVIRRDRAGLFRFVSAQSETGARLLDAHGADAAALETIFLIDGAHLYRKSDAVLRILARLGWPWAAARWLRPVPRSWRDAGYSAFARHRYRLFGKRDACPLPDPQWRDRFLA